MKHLKAPFISLVVVLMLVTVASADSPDPGSGSVNFTVMNMDASASATVRADYINQSGSVEKYVEQTLDPRSSAGFAIGDSALPDNWIGSVIASSDKEIVAFAQARWEGGANGDGKTAGAYNGFTEGASKLYFPSLAARDGKQFSRLSIQSAEAASSSETIDITIEFYDRDGNLSQTVNDTVLKGSQKTYSLLDDVNLTADWKGSAVVEGGGPIAGVSTMHWKEYTGAYSGVTGGGLEAYLPSITRRLPSGPWYQYTAVLVQNLNTTTAASVTTYWYDRDGNEVHSFTDSIPPNSSHGYNTRWTNSDVPNHNAFHNGLGDDFNGSVKITSNVDIVAIANLQWTTDSPVGLAATAYSSEPGGYSEVAVPATFRREDSGTWKQFSGLIVQNVGSAACNNFDVEWRDRSGTLLLSYQDSLNPNISHGYNSRYGGQVPSGADVADLGTDFRGSVFISASGCELIAIHNTLWNVWTDSTTYNAFGKNP
ncbi:MAG: hypothetical protein DRJ03_10630 [Chloroflexi bacterium]|nr:MAG: hypothetical protein DRI81_00805 [Chloroflexota bacterium]RLC85777.1 MAG: hypothetical protein DRJ03_10630 [Chloroflexota bacterium]